MRWLTAILLSAVMVNSSFGFWFSSKPKETTLQELKIDGEIDRNNAEFTLNFEAEIGDDKKELELISGDVACLDYEISDKDHEISRTETALLVKFKRAGKKQVKLRFAVKVTKSGELRKVIFRTPSVPLRNLSFNYPEKFNVKVKGSLKKEVTKNANGGSNLQTFLPGGRDVEISWIPSVITSRSQETAASAEVVAVADVNVDTVLYNYLFKYKVIRNRLNNLSFEIPQSVVVTDISGEGVRDWVVADENGRQVLKVYLNRFPTDRYQLKLSAEQRIQAVPSDFNLKVVRPLEMMRSSGYLELGSFKGIKMAPVKQMGVTRAAPNVGVFHENLAERKLPRTLYMFSRIPFEMSLHTEFIKTVMAVDYQTLLNVEKERVGVECKAEVEIRDNPARELLFKVPESYLVSNVNALGFGSDYRVEKVDGHQQVKLVLSKPIIGKVSVELKLENDRINGASHAVPRITLENAYSHRGVLIFHTALGLNCEIFDTQGLRQVSLNSVSVRGKGLSSAWRYKIADWQASFKIEQKPVTIYADSFHLYSLGDSSAFGSTLINLHVTGAPIDRLKLHISPELKNVEFTGRSIRKWSSKDNVWTLELSEKIFGDYTMLVRFDTPLNSQSNSYKYQFIEVAEAEHENGYMVLAGTEGVKIPKAEYDGQIVELPAGELPSEYGVLVNSTILKCYRYSREKGKSTAVSFEAFRYKHASMLSLVVDFTSAVTQVSENGELVTTVTYRLKNASEQYFQVKIPEEAKLWAAKIEGKTVQLAQSEGALMVPLNKLRDPSKLINLQLTYAKKIASLEDRSKFKLSLPLVKGQGTYAQWKVVVPKKYRFVNVDSNMELKVKDQHGQRVQKDDTGYVNALKYTWSFIARRREFVFIMCCLAISIFLATMAAHFKNGFGKVLWSGSVLTFVGTLVMITNFRAVKLWLDGFGVTENVVDLSKSVNLGGELLSVEAKVAETFFYNTPFVFWSFLAVALVALLLGLIKRNYLLCGVSLAAFIISADQSNMLSLAAALLSFACLAWLVLYASFGMVAKLFTHRKKPVTAAILVLLAINGDLFAKDVELAPTVKKQPEYILDRADYQIEVVKGKPWAKVICKLSWEKPKSTTLTITSGKSVLEKWSPAGLKIDSSNGSTVLKVNDKKALDVVIEYLIPISRNDDKFELGFTPVTSLRQSVEMQLPEEDYEIDSSGVVHQKVKVSGGKTTVTLVPLFKNTLNVNWRRKIESRTAEKADFMSELHTLVYLTEGVVYYDNLVDLQVVSGLLEQVEMSLPVNQYPVSVEGAEVANWYYDQEKSLLTLGFKKKLNGSCKLRITTQQATKSFPGEWDIQPLNLVEASQKRGRLNLLADNSVDFKVLVHKNGLKLQSEPDFEKYKIAEHFSSQLRMNVKSFRFSNQQLQLKVAVKPMKADIRVTEGSMYHIEEERILYNSTFDVTVLKAGVYSLRINIPAGFDVDRVVCDGISHWDEFAEDGRSYLMLFFKERLLGKTRIATVMSRINQDDARYSIEAVEFAGSTKHSGGLKVVSESGTRLELVNKEGVAEVTSSRSRKTASNELQFRILRADRTVEVKVDRLKSWVELDKLTKITLRDKNCRIEENLHVKVENAGIKHITVVAPENAGQLDFDGKNIVKVDRNGNLWKVTFGQRIFGNYNLKVRYQFGYDGAMAEFKPMGVKDVDLLRAYICLRVESTRLQVKAEDLKKSLKGIESMLLPLRWQKEVSEAVNCWQNADDTYQLQLQVQQYDSAEGLPAEVNSVHIDTVVTEDGEQVSRAVIRIKPGSKRYLVVNLPKGQKLWRASVDQAFVNPLKEKDALMVPLQQQIFSGSEAANEVKIELVYAGEAINSWALDAQIYEGPKFDLPLRNVTWSLYVPEGHYKNFDGTMQWLRDRSGEKRLWDITALEQAVSQRVGSEEQKVKSLYRQGVNFANKGDNVAARQMYEQALNFGMSRELNEDLQVQLQDLQRSQAVVGLVKRRNDAFSNITVLSEDNRVKIEERDWNEGSFNPKLMTQVSKNLGRSETDLFNQISDKIISQQRSVKRKLRLINPSVPWNGKKLVFERKLQVTPNDEMKLTFTRKSLYKKATKNWQALAGITLFCIFVGGALQYSRRSWSKCNRSKSRKS